MPSLSKHEPVRALSLRVPGFGWRDRRRLRIEDIEFLGCRPGLFLGSLVRRLDFLAADHGTAEIGLDYLLLGRARAVDGDCEGDLGVQSDAELVEAESHARQLRVAL